MRVDSKLVIPDQSIRTNTERRNVETAGLATAKDYSVRWIITLSWNAEEKGVASWVIAPI